MSVSILRRLLRFVRPHIKFLLPALLCAIFSISLSLYAPILIGRAVDLIVGPGDVDMQGVLSILLFLGAVMGLGALFQWLMSLCTNQVTYSAVKDLRVQLFAKLESVPLRYIDQSAHGDLISRMVNDIDQVSDGLIQGFSQLFTGIITILGTLGLMASINPSIALVVVCLTPVSLAVAALIARYSASSFRRQSRIRGELGGYLEELVSGMKTAKAFGYESRAQEEFDEINGRLYDAGFTAQFSSSITQPGTRFVNNMVYAAVAITGALAILSGRMSIGQLSSFLSYATQYTKPFNEISGVAAELQTAMASAARVFAVLDEPDEQPDAADAQVLSGCEGEVALEHISFSYSPAQPLIEGLTLRAAPGQRIAIVGPTGCGKTTLINLLMRFYDVTGGHITVDGADIRSATRSSLRTLYGMVLQDTWLFSGTVGENIAYGRPEATAQEIIEAAKAAHAHDFISRLPLGYDTPVNSSGGSLSQGQRQLLCIARVMLTHPPMLILDEATSSIDTRTELKVQQAFDAMMEGRTSFVVAHRLSTIREADSILVMRDGKIVEQGNHETLLALGGFYATLYHSQFVPSEG